MRQEVETPLSAGLRTDMLESLKCSPRPCSCILGRDPGTGKGLKGKIGRIGKDGQRKDGKRKG